MADDGLPHLALEDAVPDTPGTGSPRATSPEGDSSAKRSPQGPLGLPNGFLRACAQRWPLRSGGLALQSAAGEQSFEKLCAGELSEEDSDQIRIDVERSSVDDLELLFVDGLTEVELLQKLTRLLRAWCCRQPNGYCQGMNFVGMVLLVVMHHGHDMLNAEEDAFWTFAAVMDVLLPADFYSAPQMPGLQRDARVLFHLFQLARGDLLSEASAGDAVSDSEWHDIIRLTAYKWFVPCFVNQLPLRTLLLYWDRLFLRSSYVGGLDHSGGGTHAHLLLGLALLRSTLHEAREAMDLARPGTWPRGPSPNPTPPRMLLPTGEHSPPRCR